MKQDSAFKATIFKAIGLAILGVSIAFNLVLYQQAKHYYLEVNQTRLDPLGLSYYPTDTRLDTRLDTRSGNQANVSRVVFFGDSRAEAWTFPDLDRYEFINRGISAQTSVQAIQRFSPHVSSLKPKVIVIQVGINDLKTIALFPERTAEIVRNCQVNLQRIVAESKKLGAVVIITTIFPIGEVPLERRPFWSDKIGTAVQAMNAHITTLADDQVFVLDTFSLLSDRQGQMLPQYSSDELHVNESGYAILNQKLVELLQKIQPPIR
jgi:lysophospholipase L1-like esterase